MTRFSRVLNAFTAPVNAALAVANAYEGNSFLVGLTTIACLLGVGVLVHDACEDTP